MEPAAPPLARLEARGHWGIKRGLDNIHALLGELDRPDRAFAVVLIGGTNGKGSTGAFIAHALRAGGHRVGWTTSPHLVHPRERLWVDGAAVSAAALDEALTRVFAAEAALGLQATYFELMIAAALWTFRNRGVDIAIVEVGLGGRWDATNACEPILSVLASVGLDHTAMLGETRELIGREKLCIARNGRPLVLGPGLDPAWIVPLLECDPVLCPAPNVTGEVAWDHSRVEGHAVALAGAHQLNNLATAREVLQRLAPLGFPVEASAVWRGLGSAVIPGRLWKVPGLAGVWMDGAHNPHGAAALANHCLRCGVRPHLLFGAMGDKDLTGMAEALKAMAPRSLTFVRGPDPRYAGFEALRAAWGAPEAPCLDLAGAWGWLRQPSDGPRLVAGSLYLMGHLLVEGGVNPSGDAAD